jgi:hypothetical protein
MTKLARDSHMYIGYFGNGVDMSANDMQINRIRRCFRFMARHHKAVAIENVARTWIGRFAQQWRSRHPDA